MKRCQSSTCRCWVRIDGQSCTGRQSVTGILQALDRCIPLTAHHSHKRLLSP
ncbi:hypothetical protein E2562_021443, partial [Oryza meyeriana var. granulata]